MQKKLRVAAYARVPTTKRGVKGIPVDFQRGEIERAVRVVAKDLGFPSHEITWFGAGDGRTAAEAKGHEEHLRLYYQIHDGSFDVMMLFHESCGSSNSVAWSVLWDSMKEIGVKLYILTRPLDLHSHRDKMMSQVDRLTPPQVPGRE